jgi:hypothetical protein
MPKYKVSKNFTLRGAKFVDARSESEAIALAKFDQSLEFFTSGTLIDYDRWQNTGIVHAENEDVEAIEVKDQD